MLILRRLTIAPLVLIRIVSACAAANTNPPRPGTLNYVVGEVWVGTGRVDQKSAGFTELKVDQSLRTGNGAVEVVLTQNVFLRVGRNSALRIISLNSTDVQIGLEHGQAIAQVDELPNACAIRVLEQGASTRLLKDGLYEFDADHSQVLVVKGEARVQRDDHYVVIGGGRQATFTAELSVSTFSRKDVEHSDLYRFSTRRSQELAQIKASAHWESYYWPGWHGSGPRGGGRPW